jgi:hypothetical protein
MVSREETAPNIAIRCGCDEKPGGIDNQHHFDGRSV